MSLSPTPTICTVSTGKHTYEKTQTPTEKQNHRFHFANES
jgi:hypothetical protein